MCELFELLESQVERWFGSTTDY